MSLKLCIVVLCFSTSVLSESVVKTLVGDFVSCAFRDKSTECLEDRSSKKLHELNNIFKEDLWDSERISKSLKDDEVKSDPEVKELESENKEIMEKIKSREKNDHTLIDEISDLFTYGMVKIFNFFSPGPGEDENSSAKKNAKDAGYEEVAGRGHKKKYLKKQNKKLKIILLLMLFKHKVKMFVAKFQVLLQMKFLALTGANLLVNVIRLWWDFKKQYKPHKVTYYENAHHQHHYDHEHFHDEHDGHLSYPSSHSRQSAPQTYGENNWTNSFSSKSGRITREGTMPTMKKNTVAGGRGQDLTLKSNRSKRSLHKTNQM